MEEWGVRPGFWHLTPAPGTAPPPTLVLHGTADELVPISQAKSLKDKLDSLGVPCVYRPVPGWPHTMDLIQRVNDYFKATLNEFFERYVK